MARQLLPFLPDNFWNLILILKEIDSRRKEKKKKRGGREGEKKTPTNNSNTTSEDKIYQASKTA